MKKKGHDQTAGGKVTGDQVVNSGDTYNVNNAGVVGRNVNLENVNITQDFSTHVANVPDDLAGQLALLRDELKKWQRSEDDAGRDTSEVDKAIGTVTAAKEALEKGEENKAIGYLKTAGGWLFDFATKIGVSLVTELLKQQTGLR